MFLLLEIPHAFFSNSVLKMSIDATLEDHFTLVLYVSERNIFGKMPFLSMVMTYFDTMISWVGIKIVFGLNFFIGG